jgi:hypothetical protein
VEGGSGVGRSIYVRTCVIVFAGFSVNVIGSFVCILLIPFNCCKSERVRCSSLSEMHGTIVVSLFESDYR